MRFTDLTFPELADAAREGAVAVVPTGCTEQQGPHLAVGFDSWFAEELVEAAAARVEADGISVVVLPALPFGPTPEHRNFGAGYVDVPIETHEAVVAAVLQSLAEQGFARVLVWRGCGGHDVRSVIEAFNARWRGTATAYLPRHPFHDIWCEVADPTIPGGHADSFATSIAWFRHPEHVRLDRIPDTVSEEPAWGDPDLDFARYSATGVIGDPRHASAALGEQLWDRSVEAVVAILREIVSNPDNVFIEPTM